MRRLRFIVVLGAFGVLGAIAGILTTPTFGSAQGEPCQDEHQCPIILGDCVYHPYWGCEETETIWGCETYHEGCP